ncbi:MAG: hypothetical protein EOP06_23390 [Proteobacteria bacterium]|nr:MAG: hypothetical protein EOP06_23390 [Pseudomonadota bacterium]
MKSTKADFYSMGSAQKRNRFGALQKLTKVAVGLRFFIGCLSVIRDPSKTDAVLRSAQGLITEERFAPALNHLRSLPGADQILREKRLLPSMDLTRLKSYPSDSLGYVYSRHMEMNKLDPEFYDVDFSDDMTYVFYRYGKIHDLLHILTGFDTSIEGEIGLLSYSYAQNRGSGSLLTAVLGLLHGLLYKPKELYQYASTFVAGWQMGRAGAPFFTLDWEWALKQDVTEVRQRLRLPNSSGGTNESIAPEAPPITA